MGVPSAPVERVAVSYPLGSSSALDASTVGGSTYHGPVTAAVSATVTVIALEETAALLFTADRGRGISIHG